MRFSVIRLGLAMSMAALAEAPGKLSQDLRNAQGTVNVIVQFSTENESRHRDKIQKHGGQLRGTFGRIRASAASMDAQALANLADDPEVKYISLDRPVRASVDHGQRVAQSAGLLSSGYTGSAIGVAVIDSGISEHADLRDSNKSQRVVYSQSFIGGDTADAYGHGTHVAGLLSGNGASSTGNTFTTTIRGVAPKVRLVNLKVLNGTGAGSDSGVIAAINRAIELKGQYNIRIINLSLGRPVFESFKTDPLCQAVESAWKAGILVVVAAGNRGRDNFFTSSGYGSVGSPGNSPYVLTVGAIRTMETDSRADDQMAVYSSKGPTAVDHIVKPDMLAPGTFLVSSSAAGNYLYATFPNTQISKSAYSNAGGTSTAYFKLSGTSMATPVVSAAAALMLQKTPGLTPDQVKARLMRTASKALPLTSTWQDPASCTVYTVTSDLFTIGAGTLDLAAAMNDTAVASAAALSPRAYYDAATGKVRIAFDSVTGVNVLWGDNVLWGTNVIWGTNVLWGDNVVWGTNVIWGDATTQGFNVLWGDTSPWANTNLGPTANQLSALNVLAGGESANGGCGGTGGLTQ